MRTTDPRKGDLGQDALTAHAELLAALGGAADYEVVAASSSAVLGSTGAIGDTLSRVLIVPLTKNPGAVSIQDGSGTVREIFHGGTDSIATLHPIPVPLGLVSKAGAWTLTAGADVLLFGIGNFT